MLQPAVAVVLRSRFLPARDWLRETRLFLFFVMCLVATFRRWRFSLTLKFRSWLYIMSTFKVLNEAEPMPWRGG